MFLSHTHTPMVKVSCSSCVFMNLCLSDTDLSSLRSPVVVHGQREGRGAVAQQTGLTATGEAHGKSCDLKDTSQPRRNFPASWKRSIHIYVHSVHLASIISQHILNTFFKDIKNLFLQPSTNFSHLFN